MSALPPSNPGDDRLCRLFAFADDVLTVCDALGIDPFLDGSLAVRALTQDPTITVRDIDLNCSENEFPRSNVDWRKRGSSVRFGTGTCCRLDVMA